LGTNLCSSEERGAVQPNLYDCSFDVAVEESFDAAAKKGDPTEPRLNASSAATTKATA
jgi:hypothetical protein